MQHIELNRVNIIGLKYGKLLKIKPSGTQQVAFTFQQLCTLCTLQIYNFPSSLLPESQSCCICESALVWLNLRKRKRAQDLELWVMNNITKTPLCTPNSCPIYPSTPHTLMLSSHEYIWHFQPWAGQFFRSPFRTWCWAGYANLKRLTFAG